MQLKIEAQCPMWNNVLTKLARHWGAKKEIFDDIKELTHWAIYQNPNKQQFKERVDVLVIAKYKDKRRRDSDGICVKPILDALVDDKILKDDSTQYVRRVTTEAQIGADKNEIIIIIKPIWT
jgi:Holliday junction resolvase RusA-like endonuclease